MEPIRAEARGSFSFCPFGAESRPTPSAPLAAGRFCGVGIKRTPIEIVNAEVYNFDPKEGTVFFMFNPFGLKTMAKVLENIRQALISHPRKIRIAYYGPVYKDLLNAQG